MTRILVLASVLLTACGTVSPSSPDAGAADVDAEAPPPDADVIDCHDPGIRDALFTVSFAQPQVEIFDCWSELADGAVGGTRTISGTATGLSYGWYEGVAIDGPRNQVYVMEGAGHTIRVWNDADTVNGNVAPSRVITSPAVTGPASIALDPERDRLYVADGDSVVALAAASTLSGSAAAAADLYVPDGVQMLDVDVVNDRLYVTTSVEVLVFDGASMLAGTGTAAPDRHFALTLTRGVSIDPERDLLYIGAHLNEGSVYVIEDAHAAGGAVTPARTIEGSDTVAMYGVQQVQVAGDELLVFNDSAREIFAYRPASSADGAATPARTIELGLNAGSVAGGRYVP